MERNLLTCLATFSALDTVTFQKRFGVLETLDVLDFRTSGFWRVIAVYTLTLIICLEISLFSISQSHYYPMSLCFQSPHKLLRKVIESGDENGLAK